MRLYYYSFAPPKLFFENIAPSPVPQRLYAKVWREVTAIGGENSGGTLANVRGGVDEEGVVDGFASSRFSGTF